MGRPLGEGNGYSLQYSCLEDPVDKGAWQATVHRVAQSQTRLQQHSTHAHRFNEEGNFLRGLGLDSPKICRFLHSTTRILEVYIEASTGFSHLFSPVRLHTTFLYQGCVVRATKGDRKASRSTSQGQGRGWGASYCLVSACGSPGCHVFWMIY